MAHTPSVVCCGTYPDHGWLRVNIEGVHIPPRLATIQLNLDHAVGMGVISTDGPSAGCQAKRNGWQRRGPRR
eukprot:1930196-Prymnesium_polylepis.2